MPTYENPVTDAAEAYEALRGLAHATRSWDEPAETYRVIGELVELWLDRQAKQQPDPKPTKPMRIRAQHNSDIRSHAHA